MEIKDNRPCNECNGTGYSQTATSMERIQNIVIQNMDNKIKAIKEVRSVTNLQLREAKDLVETCMVYIQNLRNIEGINISWEETW